MTPISQSSGFQDALSEFLAQLKKSQNGRLMAVQKSTTNSTVPGTPTAFQPFNLDPVGKILLPQLTPLQNMGAYAVKSGEVGDSFEYRAIVKKNTAKHSGFANQATSSLNGRGPTIDFTFASRKKNRMKISPEGQVSWELYRSSGPFDALGKATVASLITAKELEERHLLGDYSTALAASSGVVNTPATTGGSLATLTTYQMAVFAVNYWGAWYWSDAPAADLTNTAGQTPSENVGFTSSANISVTGPNGSIASVCASVPGAFGYVWALANGSGLKFCGFTTAPKFTYTTLGSFAVTIPTVDGSTLDLDGNIITLDGLYSQIVSDPDIPGYYAALAGAGFTGTGSGSGCKDLETMFASLWNNYKVSPDMLIMSSNTLTTLSSTLISASAPSYRLNVDASKDAGSITAGTILGAVRNQYAGTVVDIVVHPLLFDGKIIAYTKNIDYPSADVSTNFEFHCTDHYLQDFFARTTDIAPPGPWAIKSYGCPILYWPRACGVIAEAI